MAGSILVSDSEQLENSTAGGSAVPPADADCVAAILLGLKCEPQGASDNQNSSSVLNQIETMDGDGPANGTPADQSAVGGTITTVKNNMTMEREEENPRPVVVFTAGDAKPNFSSNFGGNLDIPETDREGAASNIGHGNKADKLAHTDAVGKTDDDEDGDGPGKNASAEQISQKEDGTTSKSEPALENITESNEVKMTTSILIDSILSDSGTTLESPAIIQKPSAIVRDVKDHN